MTNAGAVTLAILEREAARLEKRADKLAQTLEQVQANLVAIKETIRDLDPQDEIF